MRPPDKVGSVGKAWKVVPKSSVWEANIDFWMVNIPKYHPMLGWFTVITNHLRPIKGLPSGSKQSFDCTHELIVGAIDPEVYLFDEIDPDKFYSYKILDPLEVYHQYVNFTDAQAIKLTHLLTDDLLAGFVQPSSDERSTWVSRIHALQKFIHD